MITPTLLLFSLTTTLVHAIGSVRVYNNCPQQMVFLWGDSERPDIPMIISSEKGWNQPLSNSNSTGGRTLSRFGNRV